MNVVADTHQRQRRITIIPFDDLHCLLTQDLAAFFLAGVDQLPDLQT